MGRPELCVLFGQTFVHPQLDEYVDEVIFAEPVVINACEFIEQNSPSVSPAVTLLGATSPPSFALEVFVQCEGETRFRRLCQPFLYSHSSSNVLEVEAIVTSHLVVRGSYRSLSLVIYGNTAEDLGQFNIEVDLDSSLTNLVCSTEGKLDDLPPALHSRNLTFEEFISCPKALFLPDVPLDICIEVKQFLQLTFKILELSNPGDAIHKVVSTVVSTASSYVASDLHSTAINEKRFTMGRFKTCEESKHIFIEARKELIHIYQSFHHELEDISAQLLAECTYFQSETDLAASKQLMDLFNKYFHFQNNSSSIADHHLPQNENVILGLSMALLLCCGRESCFHFVNGGGMEQLAFVFCHDMHNSTAITLMLLGVVEQATRHSIGCEGFLGWWPREDENVPFGISEGYSLLLKLLLQKQRHDVASLATYVLHRLRLYEVASRYESAVLSLLGGLSVAGKITKVTLDMLIDAKSQLKKILKLINARDPIEDPSPIARASRSLIPGQMDGLLSYKSTCSLIASSSCCFSISDVDSHLLLLLKERGFLPLSAALLSSSILRSEGGHAMDMFVDIASLIEAIILSLLVCRSGLIFLLLHPELCATLISSLRGADNSRNEESVPLRYASMLISKGFVCRPREVGTIVEVHLRVVYAIDCLLTSTPNSEEFLWVLWELCGLSRSACGRQALLSLGHFPEAVSVLMEALHSVKELGPGTMNNGASPINLAIFHSAAEIFEVIVSDSTASSLGSWIEHAMELHKALHSSSPGSNKKDAPMRLLEWVDAGAVYHKYGALGLLRYAAVLASGGDAHLSSTSMLVSDSMDVENAVGDSSSGADVHVMENLDGVTLRDSSVAQLTTAFRILAFISENAAVAAALYNEGAVAVIYAVLVNCRFMLERSSNSYDYLVDEGTECNSTSDLLLERNREQGMVDLLIPSLVLLVILLQKLQEANEQHRNTKLMNALLGLHRELSPKLAASAADLSSSYPDSAISFGAVCHLLVSALASWPVYGWTPGLFHSLLANVQATPLLALGPKETCSLLCLMNDLFPEEGVWLWKKGMPLLSALRTLAVGTLLGPQKKRQVDWYLQPGILETLHSQLTPQLEKIAQVILHYAISTLVVIQDMVRVFIIRVACQKAENASVLVRPIFSWICDRVSDTSPLSEPDAYKVHKLIDFLASLLEHPRAKPVLLKEGGVQMLTRVLERSVDAALLEANQFPESINSAKCVFTPLSWCLPVFNMFSLFFESPQYRERYDKSSFENVNAKDCSLIFAYLFKLCQVLPVGRELLACLMAFKEISSCSEGQSSLVAFIWRKHSSSFEEPESGKEGDEDGNDNISDTFDWQKCPPLLSCWKKLLSAIDSEDGSSTYSIESVGALCSGALCFSVDGQRIMALKYLFGLPSDIGGRDGFPEENINYIEEMTTLLISKVTDIDHSTTYDMKTLYQVSESAKSLLLLMQKPTSSVKVDDIISFEDVPFPPNYVQVASRTNLMADGSFEKVDDYSDLGGLADFFVWECPETLPDRLSQTTLSAKKKISSLDSQSRRGRVDNSPAEIMAQSAFSRGSGPPSAPSGPTRRDSFRQRKPNTSRPPSMHVDDYVARERIVDGNASSNVIAIQRVSSTGGRPPSIHVDEFMARQRERQNPVPMAVGEAIAQAKNVAPEKVSGTEKPNKSRQLKADLDDDLQGIDIVFDGEETEFDDKLPFPQPDDNLQQPPPVIVEQNSPHSIVEETESDVNESSQFSRLATPLASNIDENTISSSRISASRPDVPLTREPSVSSEKKYTEQSDESIIIPVKTTSGFDSAAAASSPGFPAGYNNTSAASVQLPVGNRVSQPNFYATNSLHPSGNIHMRTGSQGLYDQKFLVNQPPLPPMPPPPTIKPVISQNSDHVPNHSSPFVSSIDVHPPLSAAFHVQAEYLSAFNNNSMSESKYSRTSHSSPSTSARPPPPLPPTPPPFTSTPFTSHSPVYNQANVGTTELPQLSVVPPNDARIGNLSASGSRLTSYPQPPLMSPFVFARPASLPMNIYGSNSPQQQGDNPSSILQNLSISQPIQSIQSLGQLQPLQPPQLPRPPQPPQHLRPPIQPSLQSEAGVSLLQNPVQLVQQPLQMLQQPQASPVHVYYHPQQQENYSRVQQLQIEHAQPQSLHQQGDGTSQQQQDPGMSLQQFFSSPEAIQSLLSDRDKLCQLLEQHPKLMQMLQERLGQL